MSNDNPQNQLVKLRIDKEDLKQQQRINEDTSRKAEEDIEEKRWFFGRFLGDFGKALVHWLVHVAHVQAKLIRTLTYPDDDRSLVATEQSRTVSE